MTLRQLQAGEPRGVMVGPWSREDGLGEQLDFVDWASGLSAIRDFAFVFINSPFNFPPSLFWDSRAVLLIIEQDCVIVL